MIQLWYEISQSLFGGQNPYAGQAVDACPGATQHKAREAVPYKIRFRKPA